MNDRYFTIETSEQFVFYRIPKALFSNRYKNISTDSKLLYGLLLDRVGLSKQNGWVDDNNRVFIFYTLETLIDDMVCGHTKACKLFSELEKSDLIERKKQGFGKPDKIYVKRLESAEVLTSEKRNSCVPQNGTPDFRKAEANKNEINNNKNSNINLSISDDGLIEHFKENTDYNILITDERYKYKKDRIDEILSVMADSLLSLNDTVKIGENIYPKETVKKRFESINMFHIEYILECIEKNAANIANIRSYLLTTIFNAPTSMDNYYYSEVKKDFGL